MRCVFIKMQIELEASIYLYNGADACARNKMEAYDNAAGE